MSKANGHGHNGNGNGYSNGGPKPREEQKKLFLRGQWADEFLETVALLASTEPPAEDAQLTSRQEKWLETEKGFRGNVERHRQWELLEGRLKQLMLEPKTCEVDTEASSHAAPAKISVLHPKWVNAQLNDTPVICQQTEQMYDELVQEQAREHRLKTNPLAVVEFKGAKPGRGSKNHFK